MSLHLGRRHVLASGGDQDVLLAPGDFQVALIVQGAQVAGAQPPVVVEQLRGLSLLVQVAGRADGTLGQDLAVLGDLQLHAVEGLAHGTEAGTPLTPGGDDAGGLTLAVDLVDGDAQRGKKLQGAQRDGRSAGDRQLKVVEPQGVLDLGDHQLAGDGAPDGVARLSAGHLFLEAGQLGLARPVGQKRLEPGGLGEATLEHRLELLPYPGHAEEDRGPYVGEVVLDLGQVPTKEGLPAGGQLGEVGGDLLGHVAQGQVAHDAERGPLLEHGEAVEHGVDQREHVGARQLHRLGRAGGPRGVDQQLGLVGAQLLEPFVQLGVVLLLAQGLKRRQ